MNPKDLDTSSYELAQLDEDESQGYELGKVSNCGPRLSTDDDDDEELCFDRVLH